MKTKTTRISQLLLTLAVLLVPLIASPSASATPLKEFAASACGSGTDQIPTSIDFNCLGDACLTSHPTSYCQHPHSAIYDMLFAFVRFITDGVGLLIIFSIVLAGIQYTSSRGDPNVMKAAKTRVRSSTTALILFIFAYAIINYVIPNGFIG